MEAKLDQLRSLVEAADRDKVELLNQLEEEKRWVWFTCGLFMDTSEPRVALLREAETNSEDKGRVFV